MLNYYLILCRSITGAQRAVRLLERSLIHTSVTKAPASLTRSGCQYALKLRGKLENAVRVLRKNDLPFGKIYLFENEEYREVSV